MLFLCRASSRTTLGQCLVFAVIGVLAGVSLSVSVCRGMLAPPPPTLPPLSAAVACVLSYAI